MKIYRIRPDEIGNNFVSRLAVPVKCDNWYSRSVEQITQNIPLEMAWNTGSDQRKIMDIIPAFSPGLIFNNRVIQSLNPYFQNAGKFSINLNGEKKLSGIDPKNFTPTDTEIDHLFMMYPRHSYPLVTETFKRAWEANDFTGATFDEVDEMDDGVFATVTA